MTGSGDIAILADHSILLAIPAFAPALLIVAVIVFIAVRDRRAGPDDEHNHPEPDEEN
ncbi:hypothetical protein [Nocardia sp. NPDC005978]|uniref:hypothetical protein n=1 Tax=unclassified Nocardia TaxID=2637762 RepID=UPI0033A68D57